MTSPIRRTYVDTSAGQVHVRTAGEAGPTVLLVHQVPSSSAMWRELPGRLASAGYRVVAPDLPGYGMSDPLPGWPDLSDLADAVHAVAGTLQCWPAVVVGHHTGAYVGAQIATDHPEDVLGIVAWGLGPLPPPLVDALIDEEPPVWDPAGEALTAYWQRRVTATRADVAVPATLLALTELLMAGSHSPVGHRAVARVDIPALLRRVGCPVLTLGGDRELLREPSKLAATLVRNGRYADLGDAGVDVLAEQPDAFAAAVLDFLTALLGRP